MSDFNDANIICDAQDAEKIVGVSGLPVSLSLSAFGF